MRRFMTAVIAALSISGKIDHYGALAGLAAIVGLGVLSLLYFAQAREVKRLREWAGRAPERDAELQQRVVAQAQQRTAVPVAAARAAGARGAAASRRPPLRRSPPGRRSARARDAGCRDAGRSRLRRPPPRAATAAAVTAAGTAKGAPRGGRRSPASRNPAVRSGQREAGRRPRRHPRVPPAATPATRPQERRRLRLGLRRRRRRPPSLRRRRPLPRSLRRRRRSRRLPQGPRRARGDRPDPAARGDRRSRRRGHRRGRRRGRALRPRHPRAAHGRARPAAARARHDERGRAPARPRPQRRELRRLAPRAVRRHPRWPGDHRDRGPADHAGLLERQRLDATPPKPNTVGSSTQTTSRPATSTTKPTATVDRASTQVAVLNGTTVTGLARGAADKLTAGGYKKVGPVTTDTSNQARPSTVVFYEPVRARRRRSTRPRSSGSRAARSSRWTPNTRVLGQNAPVVVIVGADQAQ